MYCIDTNVLVDYLRGNKEIKEKLDRVLDISFDISVTGITLCELYKGVFLSKKQEDIETLNEFIENFVIIDITKESAKDYGRINSILSKAGKLTEEIDLMIASIALTHNKILVTRNKKHFENIPDLKLEVW